MSTAITIDSNIVLDHFERGSHEVGELIGLHPDRGRLRVANRTPNRETMSWASELDSLEVEREVNFFRLDMSYLDGPDVLAGDEDIVREERLTAIAFPRAPRPSPVGPIWGRSATSTSWTRTSGAVLSVSLRATATSWTRATSCARNSASRSSGPTKRWPASTPAANRGCDVPF